MASLHWLHSDGDILKLKLDLPEKNSFNVVNQGLLDEICKIAFIIPCISSLYILKLKDHEEHRLLIE